MKTLIMLSAIPASGKTTWAREYRNTHPNTYIVSSDEIRMEITHGKFNDQSQQKLVWETFDQRIHEYAKNENATIILDALNDVNWVRLQYLKTTPEFDKKIIVLFPLNYEKSLMYNAQRDIDKQVPKEAMEALYQKFEPLSQEVVDLVDEIIEVKW